ncbi:D-tyrosyl-tRNA(Tyr) deacylase [Perkinsela sp. CCAP 1560/4]|nr:D-tyrosyl-tRNA(Tyr) deacylase [Perkinsela sp. CCAP 1560/4]|eukprot:KNH04951.1 D-tyrosyl-tRNA(Tyr) deacylase [Perkinsela sp. CCAP 1560/4]
MFHFDRWLKIPIFSTKRYELCNRQLSWLNRNSNHISEQAARGMNHRLHKGIVSSCIDTLQSVINRVPPRHTQENFYHPVTSLPTRVNTRSVSILLIDTLSMKELNAKYKSKHRPTDAICFPSVFSPLDIERDSDLMMRGCRALHSSTVPNVSVFNSNQPDFSTDKEDTQSSIVPESSFEEDLGIIALCPAYIIRQCASAIGTSRLTMGKPVRKLEELPIACRMRSRCVAIHAGLHLLGYTHEEGTVHDDLMEGSMMSKLEKLVYRMLYMKECP